MIDFDITKVDILDIRDDFLMNEVYHLYEFCNNDPTIAFWLGYYITEWFEELSKEQQYLYTKELRHNEEILIDYQNQVRYWLDRFTEKNNVEDDVPLLPFLKYLFENIFLLNEEDIIPLAVHYGKFLKDNEEQPKQS
jgi:hypothetical protein